MNILQKPSQKAQIGYNGFDMSHLEKFSSTTGELLPIHFDILNPGDKVTCGIELKTRTNEIASAAMVYLQEHVDWFFVPMDQILSYFSDWYYGIQDFKTSFMDVTQQYASNIPNWSAANFASLLAATQSIDMFGYTDTAFRLMEFLGIPVGEFVAGVNWTPSDWTASVSPVFACAYQKIWMDYYRNSDYDGNDPYFYNLDKYAISGSLTANEKYIFTMRYRSADKDFFNNVTPSPLMGSQSYNAFNSTAPNHLYESFNQWLVSGLNYYGADPVIPNVSPSSDSLNVQDTNTPQSLVSTLRYSSTSSVANIRSVQTLLSPVSIRTSFAVQKLLEVTRRAGKHYDRQTLAHFGIDVPQGISGEVYYLGSQHGVVNIGDVIATATGTAGGSTSVLGQVGGKGYGYTKGNECKFTAPTFGVLMALYSSNVRRDYSGKMLDKLNTYFDRPSWFTPEYDNLGMQPLFYYQKQFTDDPSNNAQIEDWQYRWSELKMKYNRVLGSLQYGRSQDYWTPQYNDISRNMASTKLQYVSPNELDDIMLVPYGSGDNAPTSDNNKNWYNKDPLIHECYVNVRKASKMSTFGLEQL